MFITYLEVLCGFQAPPGRLSRKFPVVHSERETPLPIPNRAVKPFSADGTWGATPWESRSPPVLLSQPAPSWSRAARVYGLRLAARSAGLCGSATRRHPPAAPVLPITTLATAPIRLRAAGSDSDLEGRSRASGDRQEVVCGVLVPQGPRLDTDDPERGRARSCSETTSCRRDDRHLAAAAPSKEWGPGDGCGSRSSAERSQRAPARTRRAWRSRSSGRRRRSALQLAFACNRTWVRTIGGCPDG